MLIYREQVRGRQARKLCRPKLEQCQSDKEGMEQCSKRCARYFRDTELALCERDCNRLRCKVFPPYDECVAANTLANVLACFDKSCRADAVNCLAERCQLSSADVSLAKATMSGSAPQ
jgi:hypothetical protein